MGVNVIEKILGNNKFYTDVYVKDTITLAKSITVKNDKEAQLYNDLLYRAVPGFQLLAERVTWQYYQHLMGMKHFTDQDITLVSVDNGDTFTLTRDALLVHRRTKEELLKFGQYYADLVKLYPELELYIKAVITDPLFNTIEELVAAEDYTIVSYDKKWIEENEGDVMVQLQSRIRNYKGIWMIGYYAMMDNLFLTSQYQIFYNFVVTSILGIRQANIKTMQAHSFHIRLYLASHHYLDEAMMFLTRKQQLFLYRNMLYLDNHAGSNFTFQTLIDALFTERNISVVNYQFHQRSSLNPDAQVEYRYKQKLLNSKPLVYNTGDMDLDYMAAKERPLMPGNPTIYDYHYKKVDDRHHNALISTVLSKDLETILMDETDSVRYKLIQTLIDSWANLLHKNRLSFLVDLDDPVTSTSVRLESRDLFKLFLVVLYASQGVSIDHFPTYRVQRVFKETLPSQETLQGLWYDLDLEQKSEIKAVLDAVPPYHYYLTSYQFEQHTTQNYRLNIGLWLLLANYSDMDTEGQMTMVIDRLTESFDFDVDTQETVSAFLSRAGVADPRGYDVDQLQRYLFSILDQAYDKRLSVLNQLKKLQDALTKVFFKFNSYTVQLINNYYSDAPLLIGPKDVRYKVEDAMVYDMTAAMAAVTDHDVLNDVTGRETDEFDYDPLPEMTYEYAERSDFDISEVIEVGVVLEDTQEDYIPLQKTVLLATDSSETNRLELDCVLPSIFLPELTVSVTTEMLVDPNVDIFIETRLETNNTDLIPAGVGFEVESSIFPPSQSSDSDLMFLALNH